MSQFRSERMKPHYTNTNNPIDFPKSENKMNDRIKELADQAGFGMAWLNEGPEDKLNLKKFAQLIVQECVTVVVDAVDHREPASTYASKIQQHFGVE